MKDLITMRSSLPYEDLERKELNNIYVMQGKSDLKSIDNYHLIIAPTNACNLRCKHCYLPNHDQNILSKDIVLKLVDDWSRIVMEERGKFRGIFHIKGGEPFMVPYLWDIIERLKEIQLLQLMLTTNGTFVDDQIFKKLSDCNKAINGHVTVIVSLDGSIAETDAKIRGKRHYSKALRFIEGLRKYGINFYLNCVLQKKNINELSAYIGLARKFGATQVNFLSLIPRGNSQTIRNWQLPHTELYQRLKEMFREADDETKRMLAGSLPYIKYLEKLKYCNSSDECVAAYRGLLYITPDGSAYTCPNIVFPDTCLGNVHNQNLREILNNAKWLYNRLKLHSGEYLCTGEKMLYEMDGDNLRLNLLNSLQSKLYLEEIPSENKVDSSVSYCFNRNW